MEKMKNKEFFEALDMMAKDKGLDPEYLAEKIKHAITVAVRKQYAGVDQVDVVFDPDMAQMKVSYRKMVVDELTNPANEILLEAALNHSKYARVGEPIEIDVDSKQLGRIAAQAAKQQIRQGLREAEREQLTAQMGDKVGEIISARVEKVDPENKNVLLSVENHQLMLFANEQLPNDHFEVGETVRVYAVNLTSNERHCALKISRTHPGLVRKLLELEVPEVHSGLIEVKGIAREAGLRTKISVQSHQENLDPVGSCIGAKGIRINQIVQELGGEKIDVIPYRENPEEYIREALAPAKVVEAVILEDKQRKERVAFVSVPDNQLSLAIGNRGQNAKLAARLTGYKIDISPQSGFYGEDSESSLREKLELRMAEKEAARREAMNEKEAAAVQERSNQSPAQTSEAEMEEYDLHCIEVEQMLEQEEI